MQDSDSDKYVFVVRYFQRFTKKYQQLERWWFAVCLEADGGCSF